jgi:phage terminase Nu1 subunit (DNA packaging protein)
MNQNARELASAQPLNGGEAAGTIAIDVAAKLLMVTPEWVRRLTKDGWITKTERGRYRVVDVVQGYIRFLKDEARRATKTASHTRLQEIRARKEELAVAQTERELIPLTEAMTLVDEVAGAVASRVNAIPARFTRNIEQRAALQREVDEALAEVADRIEKLGATFQSGRDDPAADEEEAA